MKREEYHIPVMMNETLEGLAIKPNGVYVDVTFGGGGHAREILKRLDNTGRLYAFDQDIDTKNNVIEDDRFTLIPYNFKHLKKQLKLHGVIEIDGLLADLGVSSHQFDVAERGFSTRFNGPLDMRMNQNQKLSAFEVLNEYDFDELRKIIYEYGELRDSFKIASAIVEARYDNNLNTTEDLNRTITKIAPRGRERKYVTQVFQAIRIEVNDELGALRSMLQQTAEVLKPQGRLVVMAYHSLEDRPVKNWIKKGKFSGELDKDFFGNPLRPFDPVINKAIKAKPEEIETNSRAKSARLRIARRTTYIPA